MSQNTKSIVAARVYLNSGHRLNLTSVEGDPTELMRRRHPIVGIDAASGDRTTVASEHIVSVAVTYYRGADPGVFWGKGFEVHSASYYKTPNPGDPDGDGALVRDMVPADRMDETVVLIGIDLASAVIVIYDLGRDDATWINPAASPVAIDYAIQALKLLAISEQIEGAFQDEGVRVGEDLDTRR